MPPCRSSMRFVGDLAKLALQFVVNDHQLRVVSIPLTRGIEVVLSEKRPPGLEDGRAGDIHESGRLIESYAGASGEAFGEGCVVWEERLESGQQGVPGAVEGVSIARPWVAEGDDEEACRWHVA